MEFKWILEKNLIFGYDTNKIINQNKIKSIYLFDLDYTLIKTKSGKKFPIDKNDWILLYDNIPNILSNLTNCIIGIITNQKGLKNNQQIINWIDKIKSIRQVIQFDFIFASLIDDQYRKPIPNSLEFIKKQFVNVDWNEININKKIYYIGDAFGRQSDFSDTDIKYAINCKFKFKTPEIFFKISNTKESGSITYPIIDYFLDLEQKKIFDELTNLITSHKKILIVTIGFPASGKSFLRKELIKKFPQFKYYNNDDINDKVQSIHLINKISLDYDFIIDDDTNLNKSKRETKIKRFETYYKIGIWFNYEFDVCFHLNWMRMCWYGGKLLPNVVYYTLNKNFDSTEIEKGFDNFIKIKKVFNQMNLEDKIKYYF